SRTGDGLELDEPVRLGLGDLVVGGDTPTHRPADALLVPGPDAAVPRHAFDVQDPRPPLRTLLAIGDVGEDGVDRPVDRDGALRLRHLGLPPVPDWLDVSGRPAAPRAHQPKPLPSVA